MKAIKPLIGVVVSLSEFLNISSHFSCSRSNAATSLFGKIAKSECTKFGQKRNWIRLLNELISSHQKCLFCRGSKDIGLRSDYNSTDLYDDQFFIVSNRISNLHHLTSVLEVTFLSEVEDGHRIILLLQINILIVQFLT